MFEKTLAAAMLVLIVAAVLSPRSAWALINPDFTPLHLVDRSTAIVDCRLPEGELGDRVELTVVKAIKGMAGERVALDLSRAPAPQQKGAHELLTGVKDRQVLLFVGKNQRDESGAYLHAGGKWLRLVPGNDGAWLLAALDTGMEGTWNGGTDMFLRCVRYILDSPGDAYVPVVPGMDWRELKEIGAANGDVSGVAAIELTTNALPVLHVASAEGDLLLQSNDDVEFEDVTKKTKLVAKSLAFAWADFDSDGRLDLASWDGKALTLWMQAADGTFAPSVAKGVEGVPAECRSLTPFETKSGTALAVGEAFPPVILWPKEKGAFESQKLLPDGSVTLDWGRPRNCLVADFDGDGLNDLILPFETNGLFFVGTKEGGFSGGKNCGVHGTKGGGRATVGDFDGDGLLDILGAGAAGIEIFHNDGDGSFSPTMQLSGEVSYKSQPDASWCGACDFNADGLQDVYITYAGQPPLLYFNRGFRSFGQSPEQEGRLHEAEGLNEGQQAGIFADFDGDGAQDFAFVLASGKVWCAFNGRGEDALAIRAVLAEDLKSASPAQAVIHHGERKLGAIPIRRGDPGYLGVLEAGRYTVTYRLNGGEKKSADVIVEDRPVTVELK
ncbi:MAG: VCBS repeat-containing protein [Planctomycetaceae bacterium]